MRYMLFPYSTRTFVSSPARSGGPVGGVGGYTVICHPAPYSFSPSSGTFMATAALHVTSLASLNRDVAAWVDEVERLTRPQSVYWCDGSEAEYQSLERELVAKKELL